MKSRISSWAVGLYDRLLAAQPRAIRELYGAEMTRTFRALLSRSAGRGVPHLIGRAVAALADLVLTGLQERLARRCHRIGDLSRLVGSAFTEAWLTLLRSPGFALLAVATTALTMSTGVALLVPLQIRFLRPFPYPEADRLVVVFGAFKSDGSSGSRSLSLPELDEITANVSSFETMSPFGAYRTAQFSVRVGAPATSVHVNMVGAPYFDLLGGVPVRGRTFTRAETEDSEQPPVAMISERLWASQLAQKPDVIGTTIWLSERPYAVAGVMPRTFTDLALEKPDVWLPVARAGDLLGDDMVRRWTIRPFFGVARLRQGADRATMQGELDGLARRLAESRPASNANFGFATRGMPQYFFAAWQRSVVMLAAATGALLLLGSANLSTLFLLRVQSRHRELALRVALGSARTRLAALIAAEAAILIGGGSVIGAVGAAWLLRQLPFTSVLGLPAFARLEFDGLTLAAMVGIGAVSFVLVALTPAARASRTAGVDLLQNDRGGLSPRDPLRSLLIGLEAAFAMVLLSWAAALALNWQAAHAGRIGFAIDDLQTSQVDLLGPRYATLENRGQFASALLAQLKMLGRPAPAIWAPNVPGRSLSFSEVAAYPSPSEPPPAVRIWRHHVSPGAMEVVGIPIVRGRGFSDADDESAPRVIVLSEGAAAALWPGQDALGRDVLIRRRGQIARVVGIAAEIPPTDLPEDAIAHALYLPVQQFPESTLILIARTGDRERYRADATLAVRATDASLSPSFSGTMRDWVDRENAPLRLRASVMVWYALLALVIAGGGVYAVLTFAAQSGRAELAVRAALGATPPVLRWMLLRRNLRPAMLGIALGAAMALATTPFAAGSTFRLLPLAWAVMICGGVGAGCAWFASTASADVAEFWKR